MSNTIQTYKNLITSEHQDKMNFQATVALSVTAYVQIQTLYDAMISLFDLATPPVGSQLDTIGQWVGISRYLSIPIAGSYFSWNGTVAEGWNFGAWQDPNNPGSDITVLSDPFYLTLILAKIAANSWDGTTEGAYKIWAIVFPNINILIQDNENMSFAIGISGTVLDSVTQALLTQGLIPLKPEGVRISEYFIPITTDPLFGWNTDTSLIQGWGTGYWATEIPGS